MYLAMHYITNNSVLSFFICFQNFWFLQHPWYVIFMNTSLIQKPLVVSLSVLFIVVKSLVCVCELSKRVIEFRYFHRFILKSLKVIDNCIATVLALYYITVIAVHLLNCMCFSFHSSAWKRRFHFLVFLQFSWISLSVCLEAVSFLIILSNILQHIIIRYCIERALFNIFIFLQNLLASAASSSAYNKYFMNFLDDVLWLPLCADLSCNFCKKCELCLLICCCSCWFA